jgi:hypothetical protein
MSRPQAARFSNGWNAAPCRVSPRSNRVPESISLKVTAA